MFLDKYKPRILFTGSFKVFKCHLLFNPPLPHIIRRMMDSELVDLDVVMAVANERLTLISSPMSIENGACGDKTLCYWMMRSDVY